MESFEHNVFRSASLFFCFVSFLFLFVCLVFFVCLFCLFLFFVCVGFYVFVFVLFCFVLFCLFLFVCLFLFLFLFCFFLLKVWYRYIDDTNVKMNKNKIKNSRTNSIAKTHTSNSRTIRKKTVNSHFWILFKRQKELCNVFCVKKIHLLLQGSTSDTKNKLMLSSALFSNCLKRSNACKAKTG